MDKEVEFDKTFIDELCYIDEIYCFDSVYSTNDTAREIMEKSNKNIGVFSHEQTKGKGRMGKSWCSTKGKNLAVSIGFSPVNIENFEIISLMAGLAVIKALEKTGVNSFIKWPNDIIINNKKIAGILIESSIINKTVEYVIIGIGINVLNDLNDFDYELKEKAGSIKTETGKELDIAHLGKLIVRGIDIYINKLYNNGNIVESYKKYCINIGKQTKVTVGNNVYMGKVIDINQAGHLLLETDNEIIPINSGTASIRTAEGKYI